jgi:MFS family permease
MATELRASGTRSTAPRTARLALMLVCAVQFLDAMDIASMGPALPRIQADLGMSPSALQWVVSAYVLGFGGFVLLGGRLADLLRRRRLLIAWLVVFAAASLLGGLAESGAVLIGARLLKGISAAFTAPAALAILLATYREGEERNRALGIYLMTASVGFLLGLVGGGALATLSWRLTLFLPAGLACVIAVLVRLVIAPDRPPAESRPRADVLGAVSVTAGLLALVFGVSRAAESGWLAPLTLGSLVAGAVLIGVFVVVERTVRAPLVPLGIFARPQLAAANVCMLFQGSYVGFQFVATLYYQSRLGWSALEAGLAFVLGGAIVALAASRFAELAGRRGTWPVATWGLGLQALSYVWFALALGHVAAVPLVIVQQTLGGLGFAAAYPALNIAAVSSAGEREQGLASGIFIASAQVGSGLVVGVTAAVFASFSGDGLDRYRGGLWLIIGITTAVLTLAAWSWRGSRRRSARGSESRYASRRRTGADATFHSDRAPSCAPGRQAGSRCRPDPAA